VGNEKKACEVCGKQINANEIFCSHCRHPTGFSSAYQINDSEFSSSLNALSNVLKASRTSFYESKEIEIIFDELVRLNWLRPEAALFRFLEAKILHGYINKYLMYPMLDMGCGEGLFTSILFGANVNEAYDNYESIDMGKVDPYNNYLKVPKDFFINKPSPIGIGIDIKENSVKKARDLGVYDSVDTGDVRRLPYADGHFISIFSNMINDIREDDLEKVFCEAHRVLKNNGHLVFTTPNENFLDCMYYYNQKDLGETGMLDKGRSEWAPRAKTVWAELSQKLGFEIVRYTKYGDKNLISFWDTGFRPFFKNLIELKKQLKIENSLIIRNIWVEIMKSYLHRLVETQKDNGGFSVVVMRKV
jgi:SAM-dependent methyltransferase